MRWTVVVALSVTVLSWASSFTAQEEALRAYTPGALALLRFLVASVLMAAGLMVSRGRLPAATDLGVVLAAGLFGVAAYHLLVYNGQRTVTAGSTSFLTNTSPIFTALLARLFLRESVDSRAWLVIGVGFLGCLLIALGEGAPGRWESGATLVLAGAASWSVWFVLQKPLLRRYTPFEFTTYAVWAGTALLSAFTSDVAAEIQTAPVGASAAALYLGIVPSAIGYVTWAYVLSRLRAASAASFLYLIPPFAVLLAWLWLDQKPRSLSLVAGSGHPSRRRARQHP